MSALAVRLFTALIILLTLSTTPVLASPPPPGLYASAAERAGYGLTNGSSLGFDLSGLHAGWYVDWNASLNGLRTNGMEYVMTLRVCDPSVPWPSYDLFEHWCAGASGPVYTPSGAALASLVRAYPGATWQIGNEIDRIPYQDGIYPQNYARLYHDAYTTIKAIDPNAQIATGSIIQPTPIRLYFLDLILNAYQAAYGQPMPVDVWNIHNFILPECHSVPSPPAPPQWQNCWGAEIPPGVGDNAVNSDGVIVTVSGPNGIPAHALWPVEETDGNAAWHLDHNGDMTTFISQTVAMRQWMANRGYRNKPLWNTEYGILLPPGYSPSNPSFYSADFDRQFLTTTFDYMMSATDSTIGYSADGNRLIQRWNWFSLDDNKFFGTIAVSNLIEPDSGAVRPIGQDFANWITSQQAPAPPITLMLSSGWHLISTPLAQFDSSPVSAGGTLGTIQGSFDKLYTLPRCQTVPKWQRLGDTPAYAPGGLYAMHSQNGYWLHTTRPVTLSLNGVAPLPTRLSLCTGWNLVGYPSLSPQTIKADSGFAGILNQASMTGWEEIWSYTGASGVPGSGETWHYLKRDGSGDLGALTPGAAYFIKMNSPGTADIP